MEKAFHRDQGLVACLFGIFRPDAVHGRVHGTGIERLAAGIPGVSRLLSVPCFGIVNPSAGIAALMVAQPWIVNQAPRDMPA